MNKKGDSERFEQKRPPQLNDYGEIAAASSPMKTKAGTSGTAELLGGIKYQGIGRLGMAMTMIMAWIPSHTNQGSVVGREVGTMSHHQSRKGVETLKTKFDKDDASVLQVRNHHQDGDVLLNVIVMNWMATDDAIGMALVDRFTTLKVP